MFGDGVKMAKKVCLICTWFPFPIVVTVVHHVNWSLEGVVLTGCAQRSVHGSFVRSFIVQLGIAIIEAS